MDNERGSAVGQEAYQKLGWKAESAEGRAEGGVEVRTWAMVRAYLPPAGSASHPAACARASTGYSRRSRSCSSAWPNCASQAGVRPTSKPLQGARPGVTGGPVPHPGSHRSGANGRHPVPNDAAPSGLRVAAFPNVHPPIRADGQSNSTFHRSRSDRRPVAGRHIRRAAVVAPQLPPRNRVVRVDRGRPHNRWRQALWWR